MTWRFRDWIWTALAVMAALLFVRAISPTEHGLGLQPVPPTKVQVFEGRHPYGLARNADAATEKWTLDQYVPGTINRDLQLHIAHANSFDRLPDTFFFVPALNSDARFLINGVPVASSTENSFVGAGTGRVQLAGYDDRELAKMAENKVDIVLLSETGDQYVRGILVGGLANQQSTLASLQSWNAALKDYTLYAGLIGLLCALLGLGTRRDWRFNLALLVCSGATLGLSATSSNPALWSAFLAIGSSVSFTALLVWKRQNGVSRIVLGFAIVAILSSASALMLMGQFDLGDDFLSVTFANAGHLPLLAVGGVLSVLSQVQTIMQDLAQTRQDAAVKAAIIEQQSDEIHQQIKAKAVVEERQRFVRDMHDGLGGNLLSLLVKLRTKRVSLEQVETEIEGGLNDLRLVVDALDRAGNSLTEGLQIFESRARQQLSAAGMVLEWNAELKEIDHEMDTREVLNIFRLMQEVLTNAIRHSDSKVFSVFVRPDADGNSVFITMADDGKGFDPDHTEKGNGLRNVIDRARSAKAAIDIQSGGDVSGTTVHLAIPLGQGGPNSPAD